MGNLASHQTVLPLSRPQSIFGRIDQRAIWQPTVGVGDCVEWLQANGLTWEGSTYRPDSEAGQERWQSPNNPTLGVLCDRPRRRTQSELKEIEKRYVASHPATAGLDDLKKNVWNDYKQRRDKVVQLDLDRLPADALAFYRFFHCAPHEEWGIYIFADKMLKYSARLLDQFRKKLGCFDEETLLTIILCEVFHHEFFHHLVESSATTAELVLGLAGQPRPVFHDYVRRHYESMLGKHPHTPLEEALANAYAYNSLGFISHVTIGYKDALVKVYQEVLPRCWLKEPAGYRSAEAYAGSRHIRGAAQLLAMLLPDQVSDPNPLLMLANAVMPMGHTAFVHKADVPTYLVGTEESITRFYDLIPAPNATYTSLFWPRDTKTIDNYMADQRKAEKEAKAKERSRNAG